MSNEKANAKKAIVVVPYCIVEDPPKSPFLRGTFKS
jgi:hypothetical protein